jgi:quinol monooxygenase YgiN
MTKTVHIIAHIKAISGQEQAARNLLLELVEPTRLEPGSISYHLLESNLDPTEFVFVEEWETIEAVNAHMQSDHIEAAFRKAFQPGAELLAAPPHIHQFELLR